MSHSHPTRRRFLQAMAVTGALPAAASAVNEQRALTATPIRIAIKFGMAQGSGSILERFQVVKDAGFDGVEMDSPSDLDRDEVIRASRETGLPIHGVVDSVHWQVRLSDPDRAIRAEALGHLATAIDDAHAFGADTVLLVPGAVRDPEKENFEQVWERSHAEILKIVPLAEARGVRLAIEVVWNDFLTTPEHLVKYVDAFHSPFVGAYFDCSNMIRYGVAPAEWIRRLGSRLLKFDFKGYSTERAREAGDVWKGFCEIGEGEENWPEVNKALRTIGYEGWATAEVAGGGRERLAEVKAAMDHVLAM